MTQKRPSLTRQLDLSAAASKPKVKTKLEHGGILSPRQAAQHEKAILAHKRWLTRLKRATTAVKKHQETIRYYEKLIEKKGANQ
jgi:hypothetical protein